MNIQRQSLLSFSAWTLTTILALATAAYAQAPAPAPTGKAPVPPSGPSAVGVSMLHLNVTSLEASLALYRDVLGMELIAPVNPPRAGNALVSTPGAMLQTAQLRVPGGAFQMELVEWTGVPLKPVNPHI